MLLFAIYVFPLEKDNVDKLPGQHSILPLTLQLPCSHGQHSGIPLTMHVPLGQLHRLQILFPEIEV